MKVKSLPEDFVVTELRRVEPSNVGEFAIYRLSKRGIGTLEAIAGIAREWGLRREDIGVAGLKDKWAVTRQTISIRDGPPRGLETDRFSIAYLGRADRPVRKGDFERNAFEITLRGLVEGDAAHVRRSIPEIVRHGLPNYFDSQRFGSSRGTDDFVARRLVRGDVEGALKLAVATPTRDDRGPLRDVRRALAERWGRWSEAADAMPRRSLERRIARLLASHPGEFARAFELIESRLRGLYTNAYQSWIWNETLKRMIREFCTRPIERPYAAGVLCFHRALPEELRGISIPYVHAATRAADPRIRSAVEEILRGEGLTQDAFRLKGFRSTYFLKGERPAFAFPQGLAEPAVEPDDLNPGRLKAALRFELPRGTYATVLVKRLFH